MISRVAEHCFWMSRYLERSENTARVLEVNQNWLLDVDVPLEHQWRPLLIISGIHDYTGPLDAESVQKFMTWDENNICSIARSLSAARENARIIREVISADMWERINYYYLWMQNGAARELYDHNRHELYNQIKRINQLVQGIGEGTMSHDEAWKFFNLGSYLERASQTARILDVKYHLVKNNPEIAGTDIENAHWMGVLKSCSGYEPFHKQRRSLERDLGTAVADFMMLDPLFPRSVLFCLNACLESVLAIADQPANQTRNETALFLLQLTGQMKDWDIENVVQTNLHESLTVVVDGIHKIGSSLYHTFFDFQPEHYSFEQDSPDAARKQI